MTTQKQDQQTAHQLAPYRQQQGQQKQNQGDDAQQAEQDRHKRAKEEYERREKDNNPATRKQRQYDNNAPGMHPANQPDPDTKMSKGTRLDLEDITGNPGHRGVNPDAPAGSMNKAPDDKTGKVESINEPSDVFQNPAPVGRNPKAGNADEAHTPSINEPPGSVVIPPGAGAGTGEERPGANPDGDLKLHSIEPDSVEIGGGNETFGLTVTGEGFDSTCKIVFDDEEVDTDFVNATTLRATPPMNDAAGDVDVEVEKGSETSEVLTFEFTAAGGSKAKKK